MLAFRSHNLYIHIISCFVRHFISQARKEEIVGFLPGSNGSSAVLPMVSCSLGSTFYGDKACAASILRQQHQENSMSELHGVAAASLLYCYGRINIHFWGDLGIWSTSFRPYFLIYCFNCSSSEIYWHYQLNNCGRSWKLI
ncbi:uncharacterized protein LOC124699909 [Lolium rigidum]|uniref:uncharacterized protein LOC124699909 n=1 Tax=Lolium rigidum TaxID=89674 RepID=UPI001F5D9008|nr:uncharacterized protein LOC124699909 [Lolium rigidum]